MQNYAYPINPDWSLEETIHVIEFLAIVEQSYENSAPKAEFALKYQKFKQVVTSISGEKQIDKEFEEQSGFSIYRAVKEYKRIKDIDKEKSIKVK